MPCDSKSHDKAYHNCLYNYMQKLKVMSHSPFDIILACSLHPPPPSLPLFSFLPLLSPFLIPSLPSPPTLFPLFLREVKKQLLLVIMDIPAPFRSSWTAAPSVHPEQRWRMNPRSSTNPLFPGGSPYQPWVHPSTLFRMNGWGGSEWQRGWWFKHGYTGFVVCYVRRFLCEIT